MRVWAAVSGVVAAGVYLAVSELVSLLTGPESSPLIAVGSFVIDIVPRPLKEFAITTFGENDKPALLVGLGIAVVIAAAIAGLVESRFRFVGAALFAVGVVLATLATATRAGAGFLSILPSVIGGIVAILTLLLLIRRLANWRAAGAEAADDDRRRVARRSFLIGTGIAAASAVILGIGARIVSAATASAQALRDAVSLPAPANSVSIPDGAELDIPGITPLVTPNSDFYRVDTALTVPAIDPNTWTLTIDGMVDREVTLTFDELLAMGLDEYMITLTCVSNEVGGDLVGNASWWGVPLRDVLKMAGPSADADMVLSTSVDGYTASTPLQSVTDPNLDAILAVAMNGEPLPPEHGFPVRMVVPGLYGYVSATKWLERLTVTTFAQDQAYWTPRGYSAQAPIKFSSRVDTPKLGTPVSAGKVPIAGMAWAQTVGIERVEVSIDDGDWQAATLSTPVNVDTWVQWYLEWDATPGTHYITVRAVNKNGETQIQDSAPIAPDGSSGWQRTLVTVS